MKYQIVASTHLISNLISSINTEMKNGWRPIGGMSIEKSRSDVSYYYQAMILDERSIIKQSGNG